MTGNTSPVVAGVFGSSHSFGRSNSSIKLCSNTGCVSLIVPSLCSTLHPTYSFISPTSSISKCHMIASLTSIQACLWPQISRSSTHEMIKINPYFALHLKYKHGLALLCLNLISFITSSSFVQNARAACFVP